jgi:hypothetical protein
LGRPGSVRSAHDLPAGCESSSTVGGLTENTAHRPGATEKLEGVADGYKKAAVRLLVVAQDIEVANQRFVVYANSVRTQNPRSSNFDAVGASAIAYISTGDPPACSAERGSGNRG